MKAEDIIEIIMTQHWDMKSCDCWICSEGRKLKLSPKRTHLRNKFMYVDVKETK